MSVGILGLTESQFVAQAKHLDLTPKGLKLNLNSNSDKTDASDSIHPTQKSYTSMSFKDKYSIHERIGKGAYATVHRCRRKSDDTRLMNEEVCEDEEE